MLWRSIFAYIFFAAITIPVSGHGDVRHLVFLSSDKSLFLLVRGGP